MKIGVPDWIAVLLAIAAFFMIKVAGQPQAPALGGAADTGSQSQAKNSTKTSPSARGRKIPCKTSENASLCYWTHGRLSIYEGTVPYRIWKIGTYRLLGVFSGPSHYPAVTDDDVFDPELPAELLDAYEANNRRQKHVTGTMWAIPPPVFADFQVCPLRPKIKGERQPVCIESAKNIFIEKDY
jgi:hypothetical protein